MDKYVVREPRVDADYPYENQFITFSTNSGNSPNTVLPETMYLGGYGAEYPIQHSPGFMPMNHVNAAPFSHNLANQGAVVSGIDPRYLAAFMAGQNQQIHRNLSHQMRTDQNAPTGHVQSFTNNYENRTFVGADRNKPKTFIPQTISNHNRTVTSATREGLPIPAPTRSTNSSQQNSQINDNKNCNASVLTSVNTFTKEMDILKKEISFPTKTRAEKLRDLHKSGARVFSGPVEKVLKWHKTLQELGLLVFYEIVAKCVSVRAGETCAKNLVVRDDSGPAMQVVYYEIDFLLPELKPPCTIRVIGRMMPGTCRLQAFNVRLATGDDVATLQRRAAVASHHVAKLCKEYANNV